MKFRALPFVPLACLLVAGCSSVSARKVMPLDPFQTIYVERRLNDNFKIDEVLVAELRRIGRQASSGPRTLIPADIDAIMTYDARWAWDFKTYLIDLSVELHTYPAGKKLADARFYQPSLTTKTPAEVVRELMKSLFGRK